MGDQGLPGTIGRNGLPGLKGDKGQQGAPGFDGAPGQKGDRGLQGLRGRDGAQGLIGLQGEKGERGLDAPPPLTGQKGLQGVPGQKGDKGEAGLPGLIGLTGERGEQGDIGAVGLPGPLGPTGLRGEIGLVGAPGNDGLPGLQGPRGLPGQPCTQSLDYLTGVLLVKHSQSEEIPQSESGHIKLWEGYSLMYVDGNDYPANQDLGSPGSCVRKFSTMPVMSCGQNNVCNYASRNDRTFWLSTSKEIPMMPVSDQEMRPYISRCAVFEVPSNVIAVHSQSLQVPECPYGWEGLWIGYSFVMHTAVGYGGGGQALSGAGSCLQDFRSTPFIECNGGKGQCHYYESMTSFWMVTVDQQNQFRTPEQQTLKAGSLLTKVSRCQVCIRGY